MDFTGGLAEQVSKLPAEIQPIMLQIVQSVGAQMQSAFDRLDALEDKLENFGATVVGGVLADITAERTELVNDIHGIIDRVNLPQLISPRKEPV